MSELGLGLILIGMHYLIYKITNTINNKFYVGKHKTADKDDDYFGSGVLLERAIKKYGKECFTKEITYECKSEEEMNEMETDIVDEEFIARLDTYNIMLGGQGGWSYVQQNRLNHNEKAKAAHQKSIKIARLAKVEKAKEPNHQEEQNQKVSNGLKFYYTQHKNPFDGRTHTAETRKKMSDARKGKVDGKKNPSYGKHWITNGLVSKLVPKTDALPRGFEKGRV